MAKAYFVFLPDLPFFLSRRWIQGEGEYCFENGQSLKHLIEAAGIPHTEVGQVQVDAQIVDLGYLVSDGDRVQVFPAGPQMVQRPEVIRFILDNHLGRLAAYLRILGFDSLYRNDYQDDELAQIAVEEQRILLTRDRRLLMRRLVRFGYCLRSLNSQEQLYEVTRRYELVHLIAPFQRCLHCNGHLQSVRKESVIDQLMPLTRLYYDQFHQCTQCGQVYWKGSHYDHMQHLVENLKVSLGSQDL